MRLFARRRTAPAVRQPVPTPADVALAAELRRFETTANLALTTPEPIATVTHAGLLPIVPVRGSYKVTYQLRGHSPEPITALEVDAIELAAQIRTDLIGILNTPDVRVVVDLSRKCGLIRTAGGRTVGTFDLAQIGGAR